MEIALLIDRPVSSATLRDFRAPMIVVRRDCECKCDGSSHHHPAKNSNKERVSHFSMSHFSVPPSITLQSNLAFAPALFPFSVI
jgi:hypothetical protein